MITRVWHGWTRLEDADIYEELLKTEIFPGILSKGIAGLQRIEMLRREADDEVEFMVVMRFTDIESVRAMTGGDESQAYIPDAARKVLKRFEKTARHFETRITETVPAQARNG